MAMEKDIHCFRALFRGQHMFKLIMAAFPSTSLWLSVYEYNTAKRSSENCIYTKKPVSYNLTL